MKTFLKVITGYILVPVVLILIILLGGCSSNLKAIPDAVVLDGQIKSGEVLSDIKKADLTQPEEQIVTHALGEVAKFRGQWGKYVSDPAKLLSIDPDRLISDYRGLQDRYDEVYNIVSRHYHEYDMDTQMKLDAYHARATRIDNLVQEYLDQRDFRSAIRGALLYAFSAVQVVAALK